MGDAVGTSEEKDSVKRYNEAGKAAAAKDCLGGKGSDALQTQVK